MELARQPLRQMVAVALEMAVVVVVEVAVAAVEEEEELAGLLTTAQSLMPSQPLQQIMLAVAAAGITAQVPQIMQRLPQE